MVPINNNLCNAEYNVSEADVRAMLEANNTSVQQLREFHSSWDCYVFLLNETQIVRVAKRQNVATRMREEVQFLELLQGRFDVAVPRYKLVIECPLAGGLIVSYPLVLGHEISAQNPNSLKTIIDVVRFCSGFHKVCQKHEIVLNNTFDLTEFHRAANDALKKIWGHLSPDAKHLLYRVMAINIDTSDPLQVCIHNDLRPAHILQSESQIGVIDWTDLAWAKPWQDFLWLWIYWGDSLYPILSKYYQGWNSNWNRNIAVVGLWKCALEYYYGLQTNDAEKIRVAKSAVNRVIAKPRHPIYSQFL